VSMKAYLLNVLIGLDQFINTLFRGWPDETLSARAWRLRAHRPWKYIRPVIDGLFCFERNHCMHAYASELRRKQSPRKER